MVDSLGVSTKFHPWALSWKMKVGCPLRAMHVSPCPFPPFACRFSLVNDPLSLETYAPVSNMITVRCLLAMVAARGLYLWQLDIKNAFLHGVIDRELYVNQLEGFSDGSGRKLWLHKSLYGLKQSPRCWYGALEATLTQFDFCRCPAEPALFYRDVFVEGGAGSISRNWVAVYVDDILFAADNEHLLQQTYLSLNSKFILKRIDPIDAYLGVEICYSPSSCQLLIHQQRYVEQATLDLGDGSPVTPLTYNLRLD